MQVHVHAESGVAWLLQDEYANTQDKNQGGLRKHLQKIW